MGLLDGTVVTVETTIPFLKPKFDIQEEVNAPTGLITKLLKPRIVITKNGNALLAPIQPAGDPRPFQVYGLVALVVLVVLVVAWVNR